MTIDVDVFVKDLQRTKSLFLLTSPGVIYGLCLLQDGGGEAVVKYGRNVCVLVEHDGDTSHDELLQVLNWELRPTLTQ